MNKGQCREMLRKEIHRFAGGRSLKGFVIEKKVQYNGEEFPNRPHTTGKSSGMWKMGTTIRPCDDGYVMINWTIVGGEVTWNAEVKFNSKMTPQVGHVNSFMGSPMVFNGNEICNQYLGELLTEWGEGFMTEKNGWTFN
tara:strand:- start:366 stop:782 length:417 start_codon:yes stop_codon:yes gene_type:complete